MPSPRAQPPGRNQFQRLKAEFEAAVNRRWYGSPGWLRLLLPLELIYGRVVTHRRDSARAAAAAAPPGSGVVPTIVVGNLVAGGTGKTPVVAAIVARLQALGAHPGVLVGGYGGRASVWPRLVTAGSDPQVTGDEGVELAQLTGVPVVAGRDRVSARRWLTENFNCDVVVVDDGLQHYALSRDYEVVLVDSERQFGNGRQIPVGPLRELPARLQRAGLALVMGAPDAVGVSAATIANAAGLEVETLGFCTWHMQDLQPLVLGQVSDQAAVKPVVAEAKNDSRKCIALSGIAHPKRFHDDLRTAGWQPTPRSYGDHHAYVDFVPDWGLDDVVITTGKDAVKLSRLAQADDRFNDLWSRVWVLRRQLEFGVDTIARLDSALSDIVSGLVRERLEENHL